MEEQGASGIGCAAASQGAGAVGTTAPWPGSQAPTTRCSLMWARNLARSAGDEKLVWVARRLHWEKQAPLAHQETQCSLPAALFGGRCNRRRSPRRGLRVSAVNSPSGVGLVTRVWRSPGGSLVVVSVETPVLLVLVVVVLLASLPAPRVRRPPPVATGAGGNARSA